MIPHINQIFLWREKSNEIIPLLISLGIPGSSGILKASLLTVKENLPKWDCSIISFKCVCPLNDHTSLSKQKKWICHLLPTLVSLQPRADNPLGTKNSHLTLPLGFVTRAFGWVRPQGTKKTKIESKKKKVGSERNKITKQLQANSCPRSLLLKHTNWNSPVPWTLPIPMGFRQLREALAKTVSLWRWRRFWELWMPKRDSYSLWRQFSQEQGKLAST